MAKALVVNKMLAAAEENQEERQGLSNLEDRMAGLKQPWKELLKNWQTNPDLRDAMKCIGKSNVLALLKCLYEVQ